MTRLRGEDGVTLVELLTAMAIAAVVLAFVTGTVVNALAAQRRQVRQIAALNNAKLTFERVTRDIRAADPLREAAPDRITLNLPQADATVRTMTYERVGESLVARNAATADSRTLLDDLAPDQPLFLFHLADGSTTTGDSAVDARAVRSVTVRLRLDTGGPGRMVDLANRVVMRNAAS